MKRTLLIVVGALLIACPAFASAKELPALSGGKVILLWTDFEKILREYLEEEPEDEPEPPAGYSLQDASFRIRVRDGFAEVMADYQLRVLARGWVSVPIGKRQSGISEVKVNGEPGMLREDSGRVMLLLKDRGQRNLRVLHTVKAPQKPGPNSFYVPLFSVPGAKFVLTASAELSDITISDAVITRQEKKEKQWRIEAVSGTIYDLRVNYSVPAPEAEGAEKEEVPPKVYSNTQTLLTISDEVTTARVDLSYDVKHNPVTGFEIELPEDYEVIEVDGKGVAGWQVDEGVLHVNAGYEVTGSYELGLRLESQRGKASGKVSLPEVSTRGVERETGYVAIVTSSSLEVKIDSIKNLMPLDVSELPSGLRRKSSYPLLYGFRYVRRPYSGSINVKRHQELEVLNAAIDIVNLVTVFTNDGKSVSRIIYELRNNKKQYIKIDLPGKAKVWSAYLDDKPVKPTRNDTGQVLVPLKKSGADKRASFTVELIYYAPVPKMEETGSHLVKMPRADIPASEMLLSLYLPPHYEYDDFEGDLERIEEVEDRQMKAEADKPREETKAKRQIYSKRALERQSKMEMEIAEQVQQKAKKPAPAPALDRERQAERPRGMLPVKFNVPLRGSPFRFSKLIIMRESPELTFSYEKEDEGKGLVYLVAGLAIAVIVVTGLLILRKRKTVT
ncbi:MAG: hypothetical protein R6V10_01335 [bacterium]